MASRPGVKNKRENVQIFTVKSNIGFKPCCDNSFFVSTSRSQDEILPLMSTFFYFQVSMDSFSKAALFADVTAAVHNLR